VAAEIVRTLRGWRDPERAGGVQRYFKEPVVALGIETSKLRAYADHQARNLQSVWKLSDTMDLCDRLPREPEMEIRSVGILVLTAFNNQFTLDLLAPAKRWLDSRLDNWALVDTFCGAVLSPLLDRHQAMELALRLWVRRAALVTARSSRGINHDLMTKREWIQRLALISAASYPVVWLSSEDALEYARWAGVDLPTDAEWLHACPAGSTHRYPWGNELDQPVCLAQGEQHGKHSPGRRQATEWVGPVRHRWKREGILPG
jgi:3-methyladenine DNA glycosylase AlkD